MKMHYDIASSIARGNAERRRQDALIATYGGIQQYMMGQQFPAGSAKKAPASAGAKGKNLPDLEEASREILTEIIIHDH